MPHNKRKLQKTIVTNLLLAANKVENVGALHNSRGVQDAARYTLVNTIASVMLNMIKSLI